MKKLLLIQVILFFLLNTADACMPNSPESIVVWEYNWIIEKEFPYERYEKWEYQFVDFINEEKPFSKSYMKLWKYYYIDTSRIDLKDFNRWDLVITISDYDNWNYEDYFGIFEIWKISCKNKDEFFIENKQWAINKFWKEMWQCGNYRPDNVMSEEELLEKIKGKYKTCDEINKNKSSNYTRNIDDDVLIYEFDLKLWKIINKSGNPELLKSKLKKRIENYLGKTEEELNNIGNLKNYELKSSREYFLIKLYRYIFYLN